MLIHVLVLVPAPALVPMPVPASSRKCLCVRSSPMREMLKKSISIAQPSGLQAQEDPSVPGGDVAEAMCASRFSGSISAWLLVVRAVPGNGAAFASMFTAWITTRGCFFPLHSSSSMCSTGSFALTCRLQLVAHGAASSVPREVPSSFAKGVGIQQQK